jgi:hypothetical protein
VFRFPYCSLPAPILAGAAIGSVVLQSPTTGNKIGGMAMRQSIRQLTLFLVAIVALIVVAAAPEAWAAPFPEARIFIEYNATANDLGFHVFLDAEDWKEVEIVSPKGRTIFEVEGKGGFGKLGLTELFFEGAEPSLDEFPLKDLLELFPEGKYTFFGTTVEGKSLMSRATLTHAVPAGPKVSADVDGDSLVISWTAVTGPPAGFPNKPIVIVGYQVIVGSFQVTVPASVLSVTVAPEFVASLGSGEHQFEVLAIEAGGNQTITEGTFTLP